MTVLFDTDWFIKLRNKVEIETVPIISSSVFDVSVHFIFCFIIFYFWVNAAIPADCTYTIGLFLLGSCPLSVAQKIPLISLPGPACSFCFSLMQQPIHTNAKLYTKVLMLKKKQNKTTKLMFKTNSSCYSEYNTIYITLLPTVNTLIARGMFCGAKYTHHTFTPIIKHLICKHMCDLVTSVLCTLSYWV